MLLWGIPWSANPEKTVSMRLSPIQKILNKEPLLAKGPIYDLKRGELTSPLIVAIANKNLEAAMMLVDAGADINSQYGKDGETALHLAVSKRYLITT